MQRELEVALIRRALDNIENKTNDGRGEPGELSVDRYLRADVLERERALLRAHPVVVGYSSQVSRSGDVIAHDHSGSPVIVTRAADGALRAFFNACRHRGTKLVSESCSVARQLTCPYHGWSYDLTGQLRGVPHRNEFSPALLESRNLVELPVWERFGLVFVEPRPGLPRDIDALLGPFTPDLTSFGLGEHVLHSPTVRTRDVNWKLFVDGSFETYHFRTTHENTIAPLFFDNTGVFDVSAPHVRMILPKRTLLELPKLAATEWRIRPHANIIYNVFPNTIVLLQPDHAMVLTLWPMAADRTTIAAGMLIPEPPRDEKAEAYWQKNERIFWAAIEEDIAMGERIQQTLASGANRTLILGRAEHLIRAFETALDEVLGAQP